MFQAIQTGLADFQEYEKNFNGQSWIDWTQEHADLPILAVSLYLAVITYGPTKMKTPWNCKVAFGIWNFLLSSFSIIGASRVVPLMYRALRDKGFMYTVCTDPAEWYLKGPAGLWTGLFIYSKIPELLDTLFLVVQKKEVIFLHWFHHCTVLLYCWHAFHHRIAPGLWFASMNYCVHSVMYAYYFLSIIGLRRLARPVAPFITAFQVLQMVGGIIVTTTSAYTHWAHGPESCSVNGSNYRLGLLMYSTYFVLFVCLFYKLYMGNNELRRGKVKVACPPEGDTGCPSLPGDGEPDTAGLFFFQRTKTIISAKLSEKAYTRASKNKKTSPTG